MTARTSSCVDLVSKTRLNWNGFLVCGGRISVSDGNWRQHCVRLS